MRKWIVAIGFGVPLAVGTASAAYALATGSERPSAAVMRWGCAWSPVAPAPANGMRGGDGTVTLTTYNVGGTGGRVGRVTVVYYDGTTGAELGRQGVAVDRAVVPGSSARVSFPGAVSARVGAGGYGYADWCGVV